MGTVIHLNRINQEAASSWKEQMRISAYAAIDKLVDELPDKIKGKDLESASAATREAMKPVSATVFEKALMSLGEAELRMQSCECPQCGQILRVPKNTRRTIDTQHGRLALQRPYFYCRKCHLGVCPFDAKVGLAPTYKQYDLQKPAARLMAEVPFETASRLFKDLTGNEMSDHCMHEMGERLAKASDLVRVLPTRKKVEQIIADYAKNTGWRPVLVVSADGAHLPTRPKQAGRAEKRGSGEWREAKGFRIYLLAKDRIEQVMSWHEIANEEEFGEALKFAATLIPIDKVRIALIGDGAPWVWNRMKEAFPTGKEVLDYYHCSEHVHKLAEVQYPDDTDRQALWIESTMARLNDGDPQGVIWGLERMNPATKDAGKEIRKLIVYLNNNAHRIDYASAKRGGYPRGSGGIESANKFICQVRMKRSGAWWYTINGNAMLRLRCATYNGTFDTVFARYKAMQKSDYENS
jgi:hypothetical protein